MIYKFSFIYFQCRLNFEFDSMKIDSLFFNSITRLFLVNLSYLIRFSLIFLLHLLLNCIISLLFSNPVILQFLFSVFSIKLKLHYVHSTCNVPSNTTAFHLFIVILITVYDYFFSFNFIFFFYIFFINLISLNFSSFFIQNVWCVLSSMRIKYRFDQLITISLLAAPHGNGSLSGWHWWYNFNIHCA